MKADWWLEPALVNWSQLLLNSFCHWTERQLIERAGTPEHQAGTLFLAPCVVVSHGIQEDPILNYGNRLALELWECSWERFSRTPSRLTAEPMNRAGRERMLQAAQARGFIDHYRGVRISVTGRRFLVENAVVWNVIDGSHQPVGQAAMFSHWAFL